MGGRLVKIELEKEWLEMLPEKAVWWPREAALVLGDVHLGKATTLQKVGIPVPSLASEDLMRIAALIETYQPKRLIVLGDWIHHVSGWTESLLSEMFELLSRFREVSWDLVIGNHERGSGRHLSRLPFNLVEESLILGPFEFSHGHLSGSEKYFMIQGHVHPVVTLRDGSLSLRLPCFWLQSKSLTLPSFGDLTGGHEVPQSSPGRVFAVGTGEVFELKRRLRGVGSF